MQLRGRKQVATAGGAVAVALLAACSSSSSSLFLFHGGDQRAGRHLVGGRRRGERHDQRRWLDVPDELPAGRDLGLQVVAAPASRSTTTASARARAAATCTRARSTSPAPTRPSRPPRGVQGSRGQDGAVLPGADRPDRRRLQPAGRQQPQAGRDGHRGDLPGQDHDLERPGDQGAQPGRQPAEHADHPRGPLGLLRHHAELLAVPAGRRGQRLDARQRLAPSSGRPRPTPPAATAAWRRSSSRPPARSATWTTPPPQASGLTAASIKNKAGNYVAPSTGGRVRGRGRRHPQARPDLPRGLGEPGATSYPITYQSWDLVYAMQPNANDVALLKAYLGYLLGQHGPGAARPAATSRRCRPASTRRPWRS